MYAANDCKIKSYCVLKMVKSKLKKKRNQLQTHILLSLSFLPVLLVELYIPGVVLLVSLSVFFATLSSHVCPVGGCAS